MSTGALRPLKMKKTSAQVFCSIYSTYMMHTGMHTQYLHECTHMYVYALKLFIHIHTTMHTHVMHIIIRGRVAWGRAADSFGRLCFLVRENRTLGGTTRTVQGSSGKGFPRLLTCGFSAHIFSPLLLTPLGSCGAQWPSAEARKSFLVLMWLTEGDALGWDLGAEVERAAPRWSWRMQVFIGRT